MLLLAFAITAAVPAIALPSDAANKDEPVRIGEVKELREKNSDTYRLSDGSYECVVYSYDKYYSNDLGVLAEIDDSVVPEKHTYAGREYTLANAADSARYRFAEDGPAVLAEYGEHILAFEPETSRVSRAAVGGIKEDISGYALSGREFVAYKDAFEHTDLVYEACHGRLKEYIVLNDASAPNSFGFRFKADGCTVRQDKDNIGFYGADGEPVFELGALYAEDSAGAYTEDLAYTVREAADGSIVITVSMSEAYASDPERVYPILIDPSVVIKGSSDVKDAFVSSLNDSTNYGSNNYLRTGWSTNYNVRRSYIKFDIPTSVPGYSITSAYMSLKLHDCGNAPTVKAYRVTGSWSESTITWNNKPGYTSTNASSAATLQADDWYKFNVTDIVKKWCKGDNSNYGFLVKDDTESGSGNWATFYSSEAESSNQPELSITYPSPILINRRYSVYSTTAPYRTYLQYRMNCYGYALHVYCLSGTSSNPFKQQLGYFAHDLSDFISQNSSDEEPGSRNYETNERMNLYEGLMFNDFATLNQFSSSEWQISSTTLNAEIPSGYRKIAMSIDYEGSDYHFYLRHSDGTWSHKPGEGAVTNLSLDNGTTITDSNISTAAKEGGYDDGTRYYLIKKSAVIDYAHDVYSSTLHYYPTSFKDRAGSLMKTAYIVSGSSRTARFDYPGDVDFFAFTPSDTGSYTITTSLTSSDYDVNIIIYDMCGSVIVADESIGNPNITIDLTAGCRYYIRVFERNYSVVSYTLYYQ